VDEATMWMDATPTEVWRLVTDVTRYGEWSPENRRGRWVGTPGPGAAFKGTNRHGIMRWTTKCTVVDYDEPREFSFKVADSKMHWGYRLEADSGGTLVTEWRRHIGVPALPIRMIVGSGLIGRDRESLLVEGMRQTLQQLKRTAEKERDRTR
jgi:hypothetical protein